MGFTGGLIAMAVAIVMMIFGRPRHGEARSFVRPWLPLVSYSMTVMVLFITGLAAVITGWGS